MILLLLAAVPRNKAGLIYLSWKDGIGYMIHLWRDPETGSYGVRQLDLPDGGFGYWAYVQDDIKPSLIGKHGTMVVLLGNKTDADTMTPPDGAPSPSRWITRYLNTRYFWLPRHSFGMMPPVIILDTDEFYLVRQFRLDQYTLHCPCSVRELGPESAKMGQKRRLDSQHFVGLRIVGGGCRGGLSRPVNPKRHQDAASLPPARPRVRKKIKNMPREEFYVAHSESRRRRDNPSTHPLAPRCRPLSGIGR